MSEQDRADNWPAISRLWRWRANQATVSKSPKEFAREMARCAHLPAVAPQRETMASLWPLLQTLLPYSQEFGAWRTLEKFLANRVDKSPEKVARYYLQMHETSTYVEAGYHSYAEESDKILHTAAANPSSREDALAVMDLVLRRGDQRYQEAYRKFTN